MDRPRKPKVNMIMRYYWILKIAFEDLVEIFQKHCPIKIPSKRPPQKFCQETVIRDGSEQICNLPLDIIAIDTGEGWVMEWSCPEHGEETGFSDNTVYDKNPKYHWCCWWPFLFGVHCNNQDLARIGIEVV